MYDVLELHAKKSNESSRTNSVEKETLLKLNLHLFNALFCIDIRCK